MMRQPKRCFLYFFLLLFCFISLSSSLLGQAWSHAVYSRLKASPDSESVFSRFEEYWMDRPYEKGKGYKQFKRWEHFMQPRLYPNNTSLNNKEYYRYYNAYIQPRIRNAEYPAWELVGPDVLPEHAETKEITGLGRMNCIVEVPGLVKSYYGGSPSGGLWKYSPSVQQWFLVNDQLPSIGISSIIVNDTDVNELYILTGDGDAGDTYSVGILKSTNGGETFTETSLSGELSDEVVSRNILKLNSSGTEQLVTTSKGVYKTSDGWETGKKVLSGHYKSMVQSTLYADVIFVAKYPDDNENAGIYRSEDGGDTFTEMEFTGRELRDIGRIELATSGTNVYAVCASVYDGGFLGLYRSGNSGGNWEKVEQSRDVNICGWTSDGSDIGGQAWYDLAIAVDPDDDQKVYVGAVNIWVSTDGGSSWKLSSDWTQAHESKYVHADIHYLYFDSEGDLYACHDGGVSISKDGGRTWNDISEGLAVSQVYKMDVNNERIIYGSQDNGTNLFRNQSWEWLLGGDGMWCSFADSNPNRIYGSFYNGDLFRSDDNGLSFDRITPRSELSLYGAMGAWVTPVIIDHDNEDILYAGYSKVYKSTDGGDSWITISSVLDPYTEITYITQSKYNTKSIIASTINGIWKSDDGGESWSEITTGLPDLAITGVEYAYNDDKTIWVSFSGYDSRKKVYVTSDGGKTWNNYSKGLPNLPVNCIVNQPNTNGALYVGTDVGIYYRNNAMATWNLYSEGLPACIVNQILVESDTLYAATYGRGIWKAPIHSDTLATYFADFELQNQMICADSTVFLTIYNTSPIEFDSVRWDIENAYSIFSDSPIDSVLVSFVELGYNTVKMTGFLHGKEYSESKYNAVKSMNEVDVLLSDNYAISCGTEIEVKCLNGGDINWRGDVNDLSFEGNTLRYIPEFSSEFIVSVQQGKCYGQDTVQIMYVADNICDAEEIGYGVWGPFSNACATEQYGEPLPDTTLANGCVTQQSWCAEGGIQNSIWFQLADSALTQLFIETSGFDTQIALYEATSCEDILSQDQSKYSILAANDDYSLVDGAATIEFVDGLSSDKNYWLQVDGSGGGDVGQFMLDIRKYPPLIARFESDVSLITLGGGVTFSDNSLGKPNRWEWTFEGGTPSFSYSQTPPTITYSTNGLYDVQLIVWNDEESDTLLLKNYIQVGTAHDDCEWVTNFDGTPSLYVLNAGGYLSGNNTFGDKAKAEYFDFGNKPEPGYTITDVELNFGFATSTQGSVKVVVWDDGGESPGSKLSEVSLKIIDIAEDVFFQRKTVVNFNPPVSTEKSFYIGVELSQNYGDTVALYTTAEGEASWQSAWELWYNDVWSPMQADFHLDISASICYKEASLDDFIMKPNPAFDMLMIDVGTFSDPIRKIMLFDMKGALIIEQTINEFQKQFVIDVNSLATGMYLVQLHTDTGSLSKKMIKSGR